MAPSLPLTSLSESLRDKISNGKVLVVGAGGIGCELLKNLVLTGFQDIEVLDLDTIDVSNLNRQFLFQRKHVGRSKAEVAKESCLKFNPNAKIKAHCANVMSKDFNVQYFEKFDLVMNALDNRAARAHVNRMCLSAKVPLIESGTSGYAGQVELIYKGLTPCYECVGAQKPKTYPACTIRTTPTEHIHCTIWAKFLFNQLFGEMPDETEEEVLDIRPDAPSAEANNLENPEKLPEQSTKKEKKKARKLSRKERPDHPWLSEDIKNNIKLKDTLYKTWKKSKRDADREAFRVQRNRTKTMVRDAKRKHLAATSKTISPRQWAQETGYDPEKLFNKLFYDDIKYNLTMKDLWEKRKPPVPVNWNDSVDDPAGSGDSMPVMSDQRMWSFAECKQKFAESIKSLKEASEQLGEGENLVWDKDDDAAMDFVASTANIRAHVYDIPMKTRFEIKAMAGNIIPAIATSNAVVAGMIVLFALKILQSNMEDCKTVYLRNSVGFRGAFIAPEKNFPPRNPNCIVCSSNQISLVTDINKMTLKELDKLVLRGQLSMVEPEMMLDEKVLISSEEGETDHMANKTLAEVGVTSASILKVEDFVQNYEIRIIVVDKKLEEDEGKFALTGDFDNMKNATKNMENDKEPKAETNGDADKTLAGPNEHAEPPAPESDDDDVIICSEDTPSTSGLAKKRVAEDISIPVKKRRTEADDCIIIN